MERDNDPVVLLCSHSGDEMHCGDRAWCLEESQIGPSGFIPLPHRRDWLVFSSAENLVAFHIPGDSQVCRSSLVTGQLPFWESRIRRHACDNGGCPLTYGMRALRVQCGQLDGVGFVPPGDQDDLIFCSKACLDEYFGDPERGGN